MLTKLEFPTSIHRRAAEAIVHFSIDLPVEAVLLVNSCARGTATPESDLDIALLVDPELPSRERQSLDQAWRRGYENDSLFRELEGLSRFARVHLDCFDGRWAPEPWDDGGGPDAYFSIPLATKAPHTLTACPKTMASGQSISAEGFRRLSRPEMPQ